MDCQVSTRRPPIPSTVRHASRQVDADVRGWAVTVLVLVALWGVAHGYLGIVHDAQLYALQAMRALQPEIFGGDLNFRFGSQDAFTAFSLIYAPAIKAIGLPSATMALTLVGHLLWLSGAILLAARLLGSSERAGAALICAVALPAIYAGENVLSYGEGFLTPRVFAEAATLWALWLLVGGRPMIAFGVVLASAALHPIFGALGLALLTIHLGLGDRRWFWLFPAGAALAVVGALAGVGPLDRLLAQYDSTWFGIVRMRNAMVLVTEWGAEDWARLVNAAALVIGAAALRAGPWRHTCLAVLLVGAGGLIATLIGADLLRNLLVTQLQLFRATWLLALFAHLGLGLLLVELWRQRTNALPITALLVTGLVSVWLLPWAGFAIGPGAVLLAVRQVRRSAPRFHPAATAASYGLLGLALSLIVPGRVLMLTDQAAYLRNNALSWTEMLAQPTLVEGSLLAVLALGLLSIARRAPRNGAVAGAVLLALAGSAAWDRRGDFQIAVEHGISPKGVRAAIPKQATVFFEGHGNLVWFYLGRRAYMTRQHGSSVLFSRPLALAFGERVTALAPLAIPDLGSTASQVFFANLSAAELGRSAVVSACRRARTLDIMLLHRRVEGSYERSWVLRGEREDPPNDRAAPTNIVYLYDCSRLRAQASS